MNTDKLQHQDELEKQEYLLSILFNYWTFTESKQKEDDLLFIASALGLSKEFKQMMRCVDEQKPCEVQK